MTLLETQQAFTEAVVKLLSWGLANSYSFTMGEAWRSPETCALYAKEGKGISDSLHSQRLAIDLNIFQNEVLFTTVEQYLPVGKYWESLSTKDYQCTWGGRFARPDSDHFSIEWNGVR